MIEAVARQPEAEARVCLHHHGQRVKGD
jgi:hypothetical protein